MLLPLFQLVTLSLALLCCWLFLAASVLWIARQEWHYYREQRDFAASLERAEEQSIQNLSNSADDTQIAPWWEVQTQQFPKEVIQATGTSGLRAVPPVFFSPSNSFRSSTTSNFTVALIYRTVPDQ